MLEVCHRENAENNERVAGALDKKADVAFQETTTSAYRLFTAFLQVKTEIKFRA
jgi:hypothetical protein